MANYKKVLAHDIILSYHKPDITSKVRRTLEQNILVVDQMQHLCAIIRSLTFSGNGHRVVKVLCFNDVIPVVLRGVCG